MADSPPMIHDSDADDARRVENGDIDVLLAKYWPIVLGRCRARLKGHPDAEDVAQAIMLRLVGEFHRGKRYGGLPYRVVVHKVTGWTINGYFDGLRLDSPLPNDLGGFEGDPAEDVVGGLWLEELLDGIDGSDGDIARMRYIDGAEPEDIAANLGIRRNAVDQALWRVRTKLRKELSDDA